jgi:hypothetical protein
VLRWRCRLRGKTFEGLPPEIAASPIYQKQRIEDERLSSHVFGDYPGDKKDLGPAAGNGALGIEPTVVDGPMAGKERLNHREFATQMYPSVFDSDRRLKYETDWHSKIVAFTRILNGSIAVSFFIMPFNCGNRSFARFLCRELKIQCTTKRRSFERLEVIGGRTAAARSRNKRRPFFL